MWSGRLGVRWRIWLALAAAIAVTTAAMAALCVGLLLTTLTSVRDISSRFPWKLAAPLAVGAAAAFWPAFAVGSLVLRPLWLSTEWILLRARRLADDEDAPAVGVPKGPNIRKLCAELAAIDAALDTLTRREAEREELRRRFVADAAHELRTPVTGLRAYLEAMRDGILSPDADHLNLTLAELSRLERLTASLNTLASLDEADRAPVVQRLDYAHELGKALELYRPVFAQRGMRLETRLPARTLSVYADGDWVAEALHNLLHNAAAHAASRATVRVAVDQTPGWVRTRIANRVSSPVTHPSRLFERFYRGDASRAQSTGGSGLGLAITRRLVEGMGGTIHIRALDQQGFEVTLRLRAAPSLVRR